jgi:ZIP family zinc transporter
MVLFALLGGGIIFFGTAFGAAAVFVVRGNGHKKLSAPLLGFAAGVMLAAAVWSLLIPALEAGGRLRFLPAAAGFLLGGGMVLLFDKAFPAADGGGHRKLMAAVTFHNVPEGMAVGLAFAVAAKTGEGLVPAVALAVGVALQNIPEGAILSLPLHAAGRSKGRAFLWGALSGAAEPLAGLLAAVAVGITALLLPWVLALAAGAMVYVVIDDIVPAACQGKPTAPVAVGALVGFVLMMILDVAVG